MPASLPAVVRVFERTTFDFVPGSAENSKPHRFITPVGLGITSGTPPEKCKSSFAGQVVRYCPAMPSIFSWYSTIFFSSA